MERLTFKLGNSYGLEDKASSKVGLFTDYDGFYAYLVSTNRLGAYEDTGLTPEEIMVMQKEKLERDEGCEYCCGKHYTERKSIADKNIEVLIDTDNTLYIYANSLMVNPKINYCPMCGRKLVE